MSESAPIDSTSQQLSNPGRFQSMKEKKQQRTQTQDVTYHATSAMSASQQQLDGNQASSSIGNNQTHRTSKKSQPKQAHSQEGRGEVSVGPNRVTNGSTALSASAPSFVPSHASSVDDFVPIYRPPTEQPYAQLEQKSQPKQQQQQLPKQSKQPKQQHHDKGASHKQPGSSVSSASRTLDDDDAAFRYRPPHEQPYNQQQQQQQQQFQQAQSNPPASSSSSRNSRKQQTHQDHHASAGVSSDSNLSADNSAHNAAAPNPPPLKGRQRRGGKAGGAMPSSVSSDHSSQLFQSSPSSDFSSSQSQSSAVRGGGRGGRSQRGEGRERGSAQKQPRMPTPSTSVSLTPVATTSASTSTTTGSTSSSSRPSTKSSASSSIRPSVHADNSLLAKTLAEQLVNNTYDCSICSVTIGRRSKIWSCDQCHIILHLKCAHKWYDANRAQSLGDTSFRCVGCQFVRTEPPGDYYCFCGKTFEPDPSNFLTPHTCEKICGKSLNCGRHQCNLPCHPGFCARCTLPGDMATCACGQTEHRLKCGESPVGPNGERVTCAKVCNKLLTCATHRCTTRTCHNGACDACEVTEELTCFGGHTTQVRSCGQSGTVVDESTGAKSFACQATCDKLLSCGRCRCQDTCHGGECKPCVRQPAVKSGDIQACACGKESHAFEAITTDPKLIASDWQRVDCKAPLPSCGRKCGKTLNCGFHTCARPCHDSDVPCGGLIVPPPATSSKFASSSSSPSYSIGCNEIVKRQCRCPAAHIVDVACIAIRGNGADSKTKNETPVLCDTKCRVKLACKKHQCNTICCPRGETHLCTRTCGKPLACGKHNCDAFCHIGACRDCSVVYRDGLRCACGRTSTPPNTRCGTVLPQCPYPCTRVRECGHPCSATCHPEEKCPPCARLVEKLCAGGHKLLKSIPCYATPSCGVTCNRLLRCAQHRCMRACHQGSCRVPLGSRMDAAGRKGWSINPSNSMNESKEDDSESDEVDGSGALKSCHQKCGLARPDCGHSCLAECHPDELCPTNIPCRENVRVYCACKRLSKVVPCGDIDHTSEDGIIGMMECTAQCEIESRNARFREALQLDPDRLSIPFPNELLDRCIELDLFDFIVRMERILNEFVGMTSGMTKTLPPMTDKQRWIIHQLATYYNMKSESFDPEPRRSVRLIKSGASAQPKMKLSDAIKLYRAANKGGGGTGRNGTISQSNILHFWDLDQEPSIAPTDLADALRAYSNDLSSASSSSGAPSFRINFLDRTHALIVFQDSHMCASVRLALDRRNLFRLQPGERASKTALQAYEGAYAQNSLFRIEAVTRKRPNGFDSWSDERIGAATTTTPLASPSSSSSSASFSSFAAPPKSSSSFAAAAASAAVGSSSTAYTSDALSDADLSAFIAQTAYMDPTKSISQPTPSSSLSSSHSAISSGGILIGRPKVIASTTNSWETLVDQQEEEPEVQPNHQDTTNSRPLTDGEVEEEDWTVLADKE